MGKVMCLECGMELESKYRHDFVSCKCRNETFVDGGNDYMRVGGIDHNKILVWNEIRHTWDVLLHEPVKPSFWKRIFGKK